MKRNTEKDFWSRVDAGGVDECWQWTGAMFSSGYGRFNWIGRSCLAHRMAFLFHYGEPDDFVMHKCNNRLCCNPNHLISGSNSQNQRHASTSGAFPVGRSMVRGISINKKRGYFTAQGYLNSKKYNLYTGPSAFKALCARVRWEIKHGIIFSQQKGKTMKHFSKTAAQGDVMFVRMDDDYTIPDSAVEISPENGKAIVAHSETGHSHVMEATKVKMYQLPDSIMDCLLVVNEPAVLEHLRAHDTHEPITFQPGNYHVRRQREYTPEGFRRVED